MMKVLAFCLLVLGSLHLCGIASAEPAAAKEDIARTRERVKAYRLLREAWQVYMRADEAHIADIDIDLDEDRRVPDRAKELYDKAIELATNALKLAAELPDAHLIIANSYYNFGKPIKTEQHYSAALRIDPARDDILSARAGVRIELQDWDGALADVNRLAELESEFAKSARKEYGQAKQPE